MKLPHQNNLAGRLKHLVIALTMLALATGNVFAKSQTAPDWLPGLLEKEEITIVITDSGLGGLSVVADAAVKLAKNRNFRRVELVFVNALFRDAGGYNSLQSRSEKLQVFSSALDSMQKRYSPDVILVACNTLSVLIPDTEFAKQSATPVVGIVDNGVDQIAGQLAKNPSARNIIFATQTTVDEASHKNGLLDLGFNDSQVITQACPQLTLYIEQGYDSMYTEMLIDAYVDEALSQISEADGPLSVSFNCTHFGYSMDLWRLAFSSRGVEVDAFLDPNTSMIDFLVPAKLQNRFTETGVTVRAISMIDIPVESQDSIGRYLHNISPATETALRQYEKVPGLFEWRKLLAAPEK